MVTVADFIHELSERISPLLNTSRAKLVEHSLTLANVCLICEFKCGSVMYKCVHTHTHTRVLNLLIFTNTGGNFHCLG